MNLEEVKDLIIVVTPIISAILVYKQNKKSQKELKVELESQLKKWIKS